MYRNPQEASEFKETVIAINRVARVMAGGRRFRFRALVVVGDGKGRVGMAVAKASEVGAAVAKASAQAKRHLINVPIYRHGTIPHEITARFAGAQVLLKPAGPGTGVRAGATVRQILEAVGITDILSKSFGSTNKLNTSYATIEALSNLVMPVERAKPALAKEAKKA